MDSKWNSVLFEYNNTVKVPPIKIMIVLLK